MVVRIRREAAPGWVDDWRLCRQRQSNDLDKELCRKLEKARVLLSMHGLFESHCTDFKRLVAVFKGTGKPNRLWDCNSDSFDKRDERWLEYQKEREAKVKDEDMKDSTGFTAANGFRDIREGVYLHNHLRNTLMDIAKPHIDC